VEFFYQQTCKMFICSNIYDLLLLIILFQSVLLEIVILLLLN